MLQGIIPPFPTGTYEFPPPQANLDTPLPSDLFALSRKDAGSAKQQKTNRDAPWHNLIPWPRDKAGDIVFGHLGGEVASRTHVYGSYAVIAPPVDTHREQTRAAPLSKPSRV